MNLRQLRYFLAVVDKGGVRRAAEARFVAQPSISQALRGLENDLGTTLFHRTGRSLALTAAGEARIPAAREVMHGVGLARSMVDAVDGLRSGRLVISSTPSQAASPLAPLVGRFLQRYPGVQIVVKAAAHRDDVVSALRVGAAELGPVPGRVPDRDRDAEVEPAPPDRAADPAPGRSSSPPARPRSPRWSAAASCSTSWPSSSSPPSPCCWAPEPLGPGPHHLTSPTTPSTGPPTAPRPGALPHHRDRCPAPAG